MRFGSRPADLTDVTPTALTVVSPAGSGVTGSGLTTTTAVLFGAAPAGFTVLCDTLVVATAPAGPAGPVSVRVTAGGGTSNALTCTRAPAPEI